MQIVKKLLIALVVVVVLLCATSYMLPNTSHVERSMDISASPATVFTMLNNFKGYDRWSPWKDYDPNMKITFSGPDTGVGAKYSWVGNSDVGSGSQQITESKPNSLVRVDLDFGEMGTAQSYFEIVAQGQGTKVTWGFDNSNLGMNPMMRWMGLAFDKMMGPDFEKGLTRLKAIAEKMPKTDLSTLKAEVTTVEPTDIVYVSAESTTEPASIEKAMGASFGKVMSFTGKTKLKSSGQPLAVAHEWNEKENRYKFDAAMPVELAGAAPAADGDVKLGKTYGGKVVKVVQIGSYDQAKMTYEQAFAYVEVAGYQPAGPSWEQYMNDMRTTPVDKLETHIYIPVK
jgi:effector-binding domain-containing protein